MKTRESGMPNEEMWSGFFSPEQALRAYPGRLSCHTPLGVSHG